MLNLNNEKYEMWSRMDMDKVILYIRALQKGKEFSYLGIIKTDEEESEVYNEIAETSVNRVMIKGITEIVYGFRENYDIQVFCQSNFGFKFFFNNKNWCNRDCGEILRNIVNENGHNISFIDCGESDELKKIQNDLAVKMKGYRANNVKSVSKQSNLASIYNYNYENSIYNPNVIAQKEVSIYVRGICYTTDESKRGKYIAIISYKGKEKEISGTKVNTTANRMIITGLIEGIKLLKTPCKITFFTHAQIGLRRYCKNNSGANSELNKEVMNLLTSNNHSLKEVINTERQEELDKKLLGLNGDILAVD